MKVGDECFIIVNGRAIQEVTIAKISGNLYTVRFTNSHKSIRLPKHRLYGSAEAAYKYINPSGVIDIDDTEIRVNRPPMMH